MNAQQRTPKAAATGAADDPPKKKRGRPRKVQPVPGPSNPEELADEPAASQAALGSQPHASQQQSSTDGPIAEATAESAQSREPQKRRRGRPPKAAKSLQDASDTPLLRPSAQGPPPDGSSSSSSGSSSNNSASDSATGSSEEVLSEDDPWASLNGPSPSEEAASEQQAASHRAAGSTAGRSDHPEGSLDQSETSHDGPEHLGDPIRGVNEAHASGGLGPDDRPAIRVMDLSELVPSRRIRGVLQVAERSWAAAQARAQASAEGPNEDSTAPEDLVPGEVLVARREAPMDPQYTWAA